MLRRFGAVLLVLVASVAVVWIPSEPAAAQQPKQPAKPPAGEGLFGDTKLLQIHLALTEKDYQAMQPPPGGGGFGFGPPMVQPKVEPKPVEPKKDSDISVFGTEFPWVHATFTGDGTTVQNVGLRYKGNSTYGATARGLKRSLKIEFDHYDEALRFHGLKTLNLHCGVHDPSKIREALSYSVFRAAGVPAPRTALAEVTITVPGKYDKDYVGLYTATEQINKSFLKAHYKTDAGLLMKPERVRSLDYLGENWEAYTTTYQPKRDATPEEQKRVIEFTKLVNRGTEAQFTKEIASYLDIDSFLKYLAVTALVSNLDSFFTNGHNYYLYLHPDTKKFHFIPWDVDLGMGNMGFYGSPEVQMDVSLMKPYIQSRLPDRLLAMKDVNERYLQILKELAPKVFTKEQLLKQVEALTAATKEPLAKEAKAALARREGGGFGGAGKGGLGAFGQPVPDMKTFVEKRTASVEAQLAGTSKGSALQIVGFGGGGGGFGQPGGGAFGPGNQLAKPLLDALDANKDGKLSDAELTAGMKRFFGEWDTDKNGTLEQPEIAAGLQKLVPPPKKGPFGGGGPGGFPGGGPGGGGLLPPPREKGS